MALVDFYNSLKASSKERINSPLYGAFILSWIGWNWEALYVTFFVDSQEGYGKIYYIQGLLQDKNNAIWYPLLSTLLILLVLPFLRIFFFWVSEQFKLFRDKIAIRINDKKWLSPDAAKVLKKQLRDQEDEYEESLSKKEEINLKLQNSMDKVEEELTEVKSENLKLVDNKNSLVDQLKTTELEMEKVRSEKSHDETLISNSKTEIVRLLNEITELKDLVKKGQNESDPIEKTKRSNINVRLLEYEEIKNEDIFRKLMEFFVDLPIDADTVKFDNIKIPYLYQLEHFVQLRNLGSFLNRGNSKSGISLNNKGLEIKQMYIDEFYPNKES